MLSLSITFIENLKSEASQNIVCHFELCRKTKVCSRQICAHAEALLSGGLFLDHRVQKWPKIFSTCKKLSDLKLQMSRILAHPTFNKSAKNINKIFKMLWFLQYLFQGSEIYLRPNFFTLAMAAQYFGLTGLRFMARLGNTVGSRQRNWFEFVNRYLEMIQKNIKTRCK